jgi:hypothetical protein
VQVDAHIQADMDTTAGALRREVRLPINTYQKIPTGGHNKAYGHHKGITEADKCSARGWTKLGRLLLEINYINKTDYFCDSCGNDLPQQALAAETAEVSDQKK